MKNIIYSILALVLLSGIQACKKDFLDRDPLAQLSDATYWKSKNDVDLALAGCYNFFSLGANATSTSATIGGYGASYMYWESLTDNGYTNSGVNLFGTISLGFIQPIASSIMSHAYTTCYKAIGQCNLFISKINSVTLSDSIRNVYIGEVRFIRAYHYFLLTQLYGDAVLSFSPLGFDSISIKQPRIKKSIVVDSILSDLNFAAANLPNTSYSGHAVRGTALAYKAKVLLTNHRYTEAATAANLVMKENKFGLYNSFGAMFLKAGQSNNTELMFAAQYLPPNFYSPQDWLFSYTNSIQILGNLVTDFECTDGLPITSSPLFNSATPYVNRDPRLKFTVIVPGDYRGVNTYPFNPTKDAVPSGFLPRKGIDPSRYPTSYSTQSDQAWILMRYAEVLLMYAEAQNEVVGPDATVYAAVNQVRGRADVNMPPLPTGLSQADMRTRIRHEFRIEFAMEGHRFFDMKRWGIDRTIIPTVKDPTNKMRTFPLQDTLWPIPQAEINTAIAVGNTGLYQTPGF